MKYIKKLGISLGISILSIIALTFFITILSYFDIMSSKIVSIFKILIPIISLFIGGFIIGTRSNNKGLLEGLKLGLIFLFLDIIITALIFNAKFEIKYLLFYTIILMSSIFGSIIGINKKSK